MQLIHVIFEQSNLIHIKPIIFTKGISELFN
jgi:hypothetical protein